MWWRIVPRVPIGRLKPAPTLKRHGAQTWRLNDGAGGDDASLGHDDDAAADVIAVAVGFCHTALVDETRAVADARVLVDNRTGEHDIAADAERRNALRHL